MRNLFLLFCFVLLSCGNTQKNTIKQNESASIPIQKIAYSDSIQVINCAQNPAFSYAVFTPKIFKDTANLPLVIAFDPHADGKFVVEKYKSLAEKFGFILVCSMNSKNGMTASETDLIAQSILIDCAGRMKIDQNNVTALGFSGGAKVAASFAFAAPTISTLICCGAAPNEQNFAARNTLQLFLVAGDFDFNLLEAQELAMRLLFSDQKFDFIKTAAKHEWPSVEVMSSVFKRKNILDLGPEKSSYSHELNEKFNADCASNNLITKAYAYRNLAQYFLDQNKNNAFENLIQSKEFEKSKLKFEEDITNERTLFQTSVQNFASKDISWWKNQAIAFDKIENKTIKTSADAQMLRLKAYLGLAVYMYIQSIFKQNDFEQAAKLIEIYGILEPKNSESRVLAAKYLMKSNRPEEAIVQLQMAAKLGFKDENRLITDADFQALINNMAFQVVLDEMRK